MAQAAGRRLGKDEGGSAGGGFWGRTFLSSQSAITCAMASLFVSWQVSKGTSGGALFSRGMEGPRYSGASGFAIERHICAAGVLS
jgi:hypothetical protein